MADKQSLFENLRSNLLAVDSGAVPEQQLICPLCWTFISFEDLTIEHCIPQSVGGRRETLTCKKCNNTSGHELDHHLTTHQRSVDAANGHGTMKSRLTFTDSLSMTTNLRIEPDGGKKFEIVAKASNPKSVDSLLTMGKEGKLPSDEFQITIFDMPNPDRVKLALVRAAYLAAFQQLGYEFGFSKSGVFLRSLISAKPLGVHTLRLLTGFRANVQNWPDDARSFILTPFIIEGELSNAGSTSSAVKCLGLFILIKLTIQTSSIHGVVIPAGESKPSEFLKLLELLAEEKPEKMTFTTKAGFIG